MKSKKPVQPAERAASVTSSPRGWHVAAGGLAALVAAILVYGPALNGPFVFDDQYLPFFSPHFAERTPLEAIRGVRPLLLFTFWVNNRIAGTEPYSYHLVNVLLHVVNALLVFFIVRKLLAWAGTEGRWRDWLAVFAGSVFLLHPAQTEAVAYVASRSENLSALFFYAAFTVFLYRKSNSISLLTASAVLVLYAAAVSTKEHTVTLPALLLLTDYFWNPRFSSQGIRRNWRLYILLVAAGTVGFVFVLRILRRSASAGFSLAGLPWYDYFYTQCRALWVYFRLFVAPFNQNADYDYPISRSALDHGAIVGLAGLLLLLGLALYFSRRFPLASYGFLAALALFAPTSSVVPIQDAVAERRLYLPMVALLLVGIEFLRRWRSNPRALAASAVVVLASLGFLSHQRNKVWASDIALWEDTVRKSPHNSRAHFQLGVAYYQQNRCKAAVEQFGLAERAEKPDERLLIDWALAEDCLGRPEAALEKLSRAQTVKPTAYAYSLMGMVYGKRQKYAESLTALDAALKIDPWDDMAYFYRGNVSAALGEPAKAVEDYRRAITINPDNDLARKGLARAESRLRQR